MSKLGSLYISLGSPEGELSGGCCEIDGWAADEIERLMKQQAALVDALAGVVLEVKSFNAETNVAGLTTRKTCAARGFMFGNDDACWFYCVGGGCGSDEPCEHQQPAGQEGGA